MSSTLAALLISCFVLSHGSAKCATMTSITTQEKAQEKAQNSAAAQQWRELANGPDFFHEMVVLQRPGQDSHKRVAVLARLHKMWRTYEFSAARRLHI